MSLWALLGTVVKRESNMKIYVYFSDGYEFGDGFGFGDLNLFTARRLHEHCSVYQTEILIIFGVAEHLKYNVLMKVRINIFSDIVFDIPQFKNSPHCRKSLNEMGDLGAGIFQGTEYFCTQEYFSARSFQIVAVMIRHYVIRRHAMSLNIVTN